MPDDIKARDFLMMVQAAISAHDFKRGHLNSTLAILRMADAVNVSRRIPERLDAKWAAIEFNNYCLCDEIDPIERMPGWLSGDASAEDDEEDTSFPDADDLDYDGTHILLDGVWHNLDPRWEGLPFGTRSLLDIAALLRDRQFLKTSEIAEAFPDMSRAQLRKSLQEIADEGLCELTGKGPTSVWVARGSIEDRRGNEIREHQQAKEQRERERVQTREKERASERQRLLRHIRKSGGSSMGELSALLPRRARSYIIKRLKELAAEGSVELVGTTKAAVWRPTTPD